MYESCSTTDQHLVYYNNIGHNYYLYMYVITPCTIHSRNTKVVYPQKNSLINSTQIKQHQLNYVVVPDSLSKHRCMKAIFDDWMSSLQYEQKKAIISSINNSIKFEIPGENLMSEISSFLWWNCTMSSNVSALTTTKLPSFRPTPRALPSGEKQIHRPGFFRTRAFNILCSPEMSQIRSVRSSLTVAQMSLFGWVVKPQSSPSRWPCGKI